MKDIINTLSISKILRNLFLGNIPILSEYDMFNFYSSESNLNSFAYPPFLIPIFYSYSADHYHIGLIKHWFIEREITYGEMIDGATFRTVEIAKLEEQFYQKLLFEEFVNNEDCQVTERLKKCALAFNLDLDIFRTYLEINSHKENYSYFNLPVYKENQSLDHLRNVKKYSGQFPSNFNLIIEKNLSNSCFCEIFHKEWIGYQQKKQGFSLFKKKSKYEPLPNIPEWLHPETNKKELFEKYMDQQMYGKAWLTINGPGFTPIEVGKRMQRLKEFSSEKGYHLWADFWCEKYGDQDSFIFM